LRSLIKKLRACLGEVARENAVDVEELWFQDEARTGQKDKITRR
jgi:hypothetical protein